MTETTQIMKTPLFEKHLKAGARMVDFAGYRMPIQYQGIMAEHEAVRERAGIFDLTHMGEIQVKGTGAVDYVNRLITNDLAPVMPGGIIYTAICREDGGILDDALAYRMEDGVMMVVNASNKDKIFRWMTEHAPEDVQLTDQSRKTALIAIQGPDAERILQKIIPHDLPSPIIILSKIKSSTPGG